MKNLKRVLLIALFAVGISGMANAQKIGHVNYERVIANMPETRALQTELAKITKTYKDDIDGMVKKLESKLKKYSAEQSTQAQNINEQRAQEVQGERNKIAQAEQVAYQDIQEKQNKKLAPIVEKARKAVEAIAKEKGLQYVIDASAGRGLLVANGEDLYDALKARLGLLADVKQPANPAAKN